MRSTLRVVAAAFVTFAFAACGGSSNPSSPSPSQAGGGGGTLSIRILGNDDQAFDPSPASLAQNSAVVWRNDDDIAHEIVAADGSFDTGVLAPHASSAPVVLKADSVGYYCKIHPSESGTIDGTR